MLSAARSTPHRRPPAFEQAGDPLRARALYATWENMMDLLGQMEQLLGGDEVTAAEYAELFALLLHEADLGMFPKRRTRSS